MRILLNFTLCKILTRFNILDLEKNIVNKDEKSLKTRVFLYSFVIEGLLSDTL